MDEDMIVRPVVPDNTQVDDARAFWRETGRLMVRESIGALDETARQILTVAGILIGLYFNAIAFGDLKGTLSDPALVLIYLAPIALLIVSATAALWVFFVKTYGLNIHSSQGSKEVYEQVLARKHRAAWISSVFLVLGVVALLVAVFRYLRG
jgi:hypothetical protein